MDRVFFLVACCPSQHQHARLSNVKVLSIGGPAASQREVQTCEDILWQIQARVASRPQSSHIIPSAASVYPLDTQHPVQTIHPWFLWFMILWFTASWQKARLGDTTLLNYLQFVHEVGMTIVESGVQWPVQRPAANQILQSLKEMSPLDWWWYIWNILTYIWDCMGLYILYMGHKPLTKKGRHIQVPTVSTSTTRHIHRSLNFHPSVGSWCRR